jgi:hypothetical protein
MLTTDVPLSAPQCPGLPLQVPIRGAQQDDRMDLSMLERGYCSQSDLKRDAACHVCEEILGEVFEHGSDTWN